MYVCTTKCLIINLTSSPRKRNHAGGDIVVKCQNCMGKQTIFQYVFYVYLYCVCVCVKVGVIIIMKIVKRNYHLKTIYI